MFNEKGALGCPTGNAVRKRAPFEAADSANEQRLQTHGQCRNFPSSGLPVMVLSLEGTQELLFVELNCYKTGLADMRTFLSISGARLYASRQKNTRYI